MGEDNFLKINVSGRSIGIVGFKEALHEISSSQAQQPDDMLSVELIEHLSRKNYIPESAKTEYGQALVREFRRQMGQAVPEEKSPALVIRVLGQGCNNCRELTRRIMDVLSQLNLAGDLEHVTDIKEIARYGVLGSPALIINGKVLSVGSVPGKKQLAEWLQKAGT